MNVYTPASGAIVHETYADFRKSTLPKPVHVVQYDADLPIIAVKLYSNGELYTIPDGAELNIRFGKRDRTFVYNPALGRDESKHTVYFEVTAQMTTDYGEFHPIVELAINGAVASTSFITVDIARNPIQNGDVESTSEFKTVEGLVGEAKGYADEAEKAVGKMPYIGANDNWYLWDSQTSQFKDSGVNAGGRKGDPGPQGVSITKIEQTTISTADGGSNIVTVTLSDGTSSTFTIKNGSKGSAGDQGISVTSATIDANYHLKLTLSSGVTVDAGYCRGAEGAQGPKGDGFIILGRYETLAALKAAHPTGAKGDAYSVGTADSNVVYIWDVDASDWASIGAMQGAKGDDGVTFTPSVDSSGNLSWTNDGGKDNPPSVNIKGASGAPGTDGVSITEVSINAGGYLIIKKSDSTITNAGYCKGEDGVSATINGETAVTIAAGENISITQEGTTLTISADGGTDVFWATFGTTTNAEIEAAYQAGKVVMCKFSSGGDVYILSYRGSATQHTFTSVVLGATITVLKCISGTWSQNVYIVDLNRSTPIYSADTAYTTLMARGEKLLDATTFDGITDWSTQLVNGAIAWRYE